MRVSNFRKRVCWPVIAVTAALGGGGVEASTPCSGTRSWRRLGRAPTASSTRCVFLLAREVLCTYETAVASTRFHFAALLLCALCIGSVNVTVSVFCGGKRDRVEETRWMVGAGPKKESS